MDVGYQLRKQLNNSKLENMVDGDKMENCAEISFVRYAEMNKLSAEQRSDERSTTISIAQMQKVDRSQRQRIDPFSLQCERHFGRGNAQKVFQTRLRKECQTTIFVASVPI